jgi:membrane-associated phospholipid phosphatase
LEIGNTFYFGWEAALILFLQAHLGTTGIALADFITHFGEEFVLIPIMGYVYWCRNKEMGKLLGANMAVGLVLNPMTKNIFMRRRPYMDDAAIACLEPVNPGDIYDATLQGFSFPSGHCTNSATLYGSIAFYAKKRPVTVLALLLILLVGLSRVFLGVHYPTDVIFGWALGAGIIFGMNFLQKRIQKKWKLYLGLILAGLTGCFYCDSTDYFSTMGIMIGMFAGILFEERYVGFEDAKTTRSRILRLAGGIALFCLLHVALKLPFPAEILAGTDAVGMFLRVLRHAAEVFLIVGPYTMLFGRLKRAH